MPAMPLLEEHHARRTKELSKKEEEREREGGGIALTLLKKGRGRVTVPRGSREGGEGQQRSEGGER